MVVGVQIHTKYVSSVGDIKKINGWSWSDKRKYKGTVCCEIEWKWNYNLYTTPFQIFQ